MAGLLPVRTPPPAAPQQPPHTPGGPAAIAAALQGSSLCWQCIVAKSGATPLDLDAKLLRMQETVVIMTTLAPCDGCGLEMLLYHITPSRSQTLDA